MPMFPPSSAAKHGEEADGVLCPPTLVGGAMVGGIVVAAAGRVELVVD